MAERKKLLLRLDSGVYEAIARWASDDLRSINGQIEYALRAALRAAGRIGRSGPQPAGEAEPPASPGSTFPPGDATPGTAVLGSQAGDSAGGTADRPGR